MDSRVRLRRVLVTTSILAIVALGIIAPPSVAAPSGGRAERAYEWVSWASGTTGALYGLFALDSTHIWATGAGGMILFFDGSSWERQVTGITTTVSDVWAADARHAWAVAGSRVLFFNGTKWSVQSTGPADSLVAIDGVNASNVWACGGSDIIYFDGASWAAQPNPGTELTELSARATTDVWAVGGSHCVLRFDGEDWTAPALPPDMQTRDFTGVEAIDSTHVWVVGENDKPHLFNGTAWSTFGKAETANYRSVRARSAADVWLATATDVFQYNGSRFSRKGDSFTTHPEKIELTKTKAWLVSENGSIFSWQDVPPPVSTTRWYFAEGSTRGGFETWILVQNPASERVHVELTYMTPGGEKEGPSAELAAQSRVTFNVGETVPDEWDVSTLVEADGKVNAERTMFWGGRIGGHNSIGVREPQTDWCMPEGSTKGGFETWVLLQNPGSKPATVYPFFLTPEGTVTADEIVLAPHSRQSLDAARYVPDTWEVSTMIHADNPIAAERAVYWANRSGGSNSIGASEASGHWLLAEGCTKGGFETWVLVSNPTDDRVNVRVTYITDKKTVDGPAVALEPGTRTTFNVADDVPDTWNVSTVVDTGHEKELVVVERSMFWSGRKGGHASLGSAQISDEWDVPEGSTRGGFETWVLVENPQELDADVRLYYMTPKGPIDGPRVRIKGGTRQSFFVADTVPDEWEVSTRVTSDIPVAVEKSIYWNNRIEGGCSTAIPEITD